VIVKYGLFSISPDLTLPDVGRTFSDMRPNGTHAKIDSLLDEMLRNYPKVEMGKAEKTAARQLILRQINMRMMPKIVASLIFSVAFEVGSLAQLFIQ
jgi:hypothetical protein